MLAFRTIICMQCLFDSAAQQCEIDTQHEVFPEDLDLLGVSATNNNKCSGAVFGLTAVGSATDTECELQCKDGYYNDTEAVKVFCEPNPDQASPDGNTNYVRCTSA